MSFRRKPYVSGHLRVTDGHELYYEGFGNPRGTPIVFLHGGPGGGFTDSSKRLFDPKRHNVIFFDQRGAGRSRPFASIKANTTPHLLEDIDAVLALFGLDRVVLVGGSWGTTLALAYAIRRPERVAGLLLGALFLGDRDAISHYIGGGLKTHFPEHWERFIGRVPPRRRTDPARYYLEKMLSGNEKERETFCFEWAYYEMSVVSLHIEHKGILAYMKEFSYRSLAPLEAHYMANACFLPPNHILANVHRLSRIPITLFHGRYDVICPPSQAWELQKRHGRTRLEFYTGGHYENSPQRRDAFKKGLAELIAKTRFRGGPTATQRR